MKYILETEKENFIYISRNGVEIAQIPLIPSKTPCNRIGIAKGKINTSDDFDEVFDCLDKEIEKNFT